MTTVAVSPPHAVRATLPAIVQAAVEAHCGAPVSCHALGRAGTTVLVRGPEGRCFAKRLPPALATVDMVALMAGVHAAGIAVPPLFSAVREAPLGALVSAGDQWIIYPFLDGHIAVPGTDDWSRAWASAGAMIRAMQHVAMPLAGGAFPRIDHEWLARIDEWELSGASRSLRTRLDATVPGPLTLAHGDVAPQNLLVTPAAVVLLDWEACGLAPAGFDAGWVCALNAIGAGPRWSADPIEAWADATECTAAALWQSTALGLLRLHWRAAGWLRDDATMAPLLTRIECAMTAHAGVSP
jgi:aminoglycoside phosphotransferase (APT) family kinase protein